MHSRFSCFGGPASKLAVAVAARGAHGAFNREQWTLGGEDRLVDALGRTESEAEEEYGLPGAVLHRRDDDVEILEHANFKPTWLLRMFHYWGSRWGTSGTVNNNNKEKSGIRPEDSQAQAEIPNGTSSATSSALSVRNALVRNKTS